MAVPSVIPDELDAYGGARALVLGAGGFIGRWVARRLTSLRGDLHLIVRNAATAQEVFHEYGVAGEIHEQDLARPELVTELIGRLRPSVVFNLAGYGVDPAERDEKAAGVMNTDLVARVGEAVAAVADRRWRGQNLVHAGSALEYGTAPGDLSEDGPATPTTSYGRTKLAGTLALQAISRTFGLRAATARLFTVYGAGEHAGRLLPSLMETAETRRSLNLTAGQQMRDFTYVEDAAEGLLRLGTCGVVPGGVVNLATGRLTKVRDFVDAAAGILGIPRQNLIHGAIPTRAEEMRHADVSIDRLRRVVRWSPGTSIVKGIERTWVFVAAARQRTAVSSR